MAKLMSSEEEKPPTFEQYTAFNAIFDAMKEKQRKKSRTLRLMQRLGFSKEKRVLQRFLADTEPEPTNNQTIDLSACSRFNSERDPKPQAEQAPNRQTSESNLT
jgi:hypothetical protein